MLIKKITFSALLLCASSPLFAIQTMNENESIDQVVIQTSENNHPFILFDDVKYELNGIVLNNNLNIKDLTINDGFVYIQLSNDSLFKGKIPTDLSTVIYLEPNIDNIVNDVFIYGETNDLTAIYNNIKYKLNNLDDISYKDIKNASISNNNFSIYLNDGRLFKGVISPDLNTIDFIDVQNPNLTNIVVFNLDNLLHVSLNNIDHVLNGINEFNSINDIKKISFNDNKIFVLLNNGSLYQSDVNTNEKVINLKKSIFTNVTNILFDLHNNYFVVTKSHFIFNKNNNWIKTIYKDVKSVSTFNNKLFALTPEGIILINNFNNDKKSYYFFRSFEKNYNVDHLKIIDIQNDIVNIKNLKTNEQFIINLKDRQLNILSKNNTINNNNQTLTEVF